MTKTYAQVQKQIEMLQREAEKLKRQEVEGVIARIKEAIRVYGLTASDLGFKEAPATRSKPNRTSAGGRPARKSRNAPQDIKFRDESGNVWGGRGPRPQWLRKALTEGKTLQDFAV